MVNVPLKSGSETILTAEDNEDVRFLTKNILEEYGYYVIEAVDGEDAVKKYIENKDRIQLIMIDVMMPKKTGKEAVDLIKAITPGVRVLYSSGYAADTIEIKSIREEGVDFISKPFSPRNLLLKIREVLDRT